MTAYQDWRVNRLGRRFMWGSLGVLAVAVVMILISAQQMFISDKDLGVLMWIMLPAAVVAALTAYARSEDRTKALRSGFQLHLAKPVDPGELMAAMAVLAKRASATE